MMESDIDFLTATVQPPIREEILEGGAGDLEAKSRPEASAECAGSPEPPPFRIPWPPGLGLHCAGY